MKLSRSIATLLALILCWGQLSYASSGAEMMADAGAVQMVSMTMDCGEGCDQVAEPCQEMPCSGEQLCSGGAAFVVPVLTVAIERDAGGITPPKPDHYRYCSITAIEHPPRITV